MIPPSVIAQHFCWNQPFWHSHWRMLLETGPHLDTVTHPGVWILWVEWEANLSRWEHVGNFLNLAAVGAGHLIEQKQSAWTVGLLWGKFVVRIEHVGQFHSDSVLSRSTKRCPSIWQHNYLLAFHSHPLQFKHKCLCQSTDYLQLENQIRRNGKA